MVIDSRIPSPTSTNTHPIPGEPLIAAADANSMPDRTPNYRNRRIGVAVVGAAGLLTGLTVASDAIAPIPDSPPDLPSNLSELTGMEVPEGFNENPEDYVLRGGEVVHKDSPAND